MSAGSLSPGVRLLGEFLAKLSEQDRRDIATVVGHEEAVGRPELIRFDRLGLLAIVAIEDPERIPKMKEYDAARESRWTAIDWPSAAKLERWHGTWALAVAAALVWGASGKPPRPLVHRRPTKKMWTPHQAALRLRDAAHDLGYVRCADMSGEEYDDWMHWVWAVRRRLGRRVETAPTREQLINTPLFGTFDRACLWTDELLGLGQVDGHGGS